MTGPICPKCGEKITKPLLGQVVRRTSDSVIVRVHNVCHEFELTISGLQDSSLSPPLGLAVGDTVQLSGMEEVEPS